MKITQNINLDFARSTMPVEVFAKQHDKDTRELVINPLNSGAPYTLENGIMARFHMTKADGKTVINNASISNGTIVVTLTAQALAAAGTAVAEVGLYKSDTLLTSQIFYINVQKGAYNEDYVESSDEYGALADALDQANTAIRTANTAASNAAGAVTTANNAAARAETAYDNANIAISDANTALATAAEIVGNLQSLLEEVHYGHVIE